MIHPDAQNFDLAAQAYERGRPDYPREAVNFITKVFRLGPESTIVDLAAGTGKLTRLLVPIGAHIIGVEPVDGMRAVLTQCVPGIQILDGTAEAIPLPDDSADAFTVAQAFHWFRPEEATAEIHRVLRPGGGLALIWNRRDLNQPLQQAIHEILVPYRSTEPAHDSHSWREGLEHTGLFTTLLEQHFTHSQTMNYAGLIDRVFSFSYIAGLPESEKDKVSEQLRLIASILPEQFDIMFKTAVFIANAR